MRDAFNFRISEIYVFERAVKFRLPFRFGVVTVTACPQAFVRVRVTFGAGKSATGSSAELLIPKWFDKATTKSDTQNIEELRSALRSAAAAYTSDRTLRPAFGHSAAHYQPLIDEAAQRGSNALTACYGPALIDRAVLDAVCKHQNISFYTAIRTNVAAIDGETLTPDLRGFDLPHFLAQLKPMPSIAARHTVGLLDPITTTDVVTHVDDGLPETLEDVIRNYGHRYFKVKVRGELASDVDRLTKVAAVLDEMCNEYFVTLDGNEQYTEVDGVVALWQSIADRPGLSRFSKSVMWIEQPLTRDVARHASVAALAHFRPVLIDESDGTLGAFPEARPFGYSGVSSKSCKGLYKSVLNAARCAQWNATRDVPRYFMSAEDLTMQAGLAVQQDLALVNLLGLTHSERNGHHYVNGFAGTGASEAEQQRFLNVHPDLYERSQGAVRLAIHGGVIAVGSLDEAGFASGAEPDCDSLSPVDCIAGSN